jgi:hypothetical protein
LLARAMKADFPDQIKSDGDELGNLMRKRVATRTAWASIGTAILRTARIAVFTVTRYRWLQKP